MPIYEYQCKSCLARSEVMQRVSDPPLTTCEECGGELKKLISAPAFQFKGDGWYVTDYARKGDKDKGDQEKGTADGKSVDAKPDAKPEAKSDAKSDAKPAKDTSPAAT